MSDEGAPQPRGGKKPQGNRRPKAAPKKRAAAARPADAAAPATEPAEAATLVVAEAAEGVAAVGPAASGGLLERLAAEGVLESGGCVSQFSASVVARLLGSGGYDQHLAELLRAYASRRDALAGALREHLPAGCSFATPAGGFFIWLTLPSDLLATELLPTAEAHGVAFAPGARFCSDGDDRSLRLAFSLYDEAALTESARRLGAAVTAALAGRA